MAKEKKEDWSNYCGNWHMRSGIKKIEIGFILFVIGGVFWVGDFMSWLWFQSITVAGLVLIATGVLKLYGSGWSNK